MRNTNCGLLKKDAVVTQREEGAMSGTRWFLGIATWGAIALGASCANAQNSLTNIDLSRGAVKAGIGNQIVRRNTNNNLNIISTFPPTNDWERFLSNVTWFEARGCSTLALLDIVGRGGLPPSPNEFLSTDVVWTDARLPATTTQPSANKPKAKPSSKPKVEPIAIVPATGWVFNKEKGEVTLISNASSNSGLGSNPANCSSQR